MTMVFCSRILELHLNHHKSSLNQSGLPVEIQILFKSIGFTSSTFPIQPAAITLNTGSPGTLEPIPQNNITHNNAAYNNLLLQF
jgi:hypothetical protein